MISGAILLAGFAAADATRSRCHMSGDPHVRGFDQPRGWTFHPVYAPGSWWLVHTERGEFQAQATYSQCGRRTGGGWQGWRGHVNTSAHCLESVAFGGSILDHKGLVISPPCIWDWGDMKCKDCTADRLPRVVFGGKKVSVKSGVATDVTPNLMVQCWVNRCTVAVDNKKVDMSLSFWGGAGFEPGSTKTCTAGTHATINLWMNKGDFGKQCGHCGDFDGDSRNDNIYHHDGTIKQGVQSSSLCEAEIKECHQLFQLSHMPSQYNSVGNVLPQDDNLCGCNQEDNKCNANDSRRNVVELCAKAYSHVCNVDAKPEQEELQAFFEECTEDVCIGGTSFTDIDVEDAKGDSCTEQDNFRDDAVCNHCPV